MKFAFSLLLAAGWLSACTTSGPARIGCDADGEGCRPFRAGMIKFDDELDAMKPLNAIDEGGWVLSGQSILGSVNERWLTAYDLKRHVHLWYFDAKSDMTAPAEVFGGFAIFPLRDGRLVKIDVQTGKQAWETRLTQFVATRVVLSGTTLLAYSVDQKLHALDFQSGQSVWVYDATSSPNLLVRSGAAPQVVGNEVYLGTVEGDVRSIAIQTGKENWRLRPGKDDFRFKDLVGEIGVGNSQIYASRYDGLVFGVDVGTKPNATLWEFTTGSITTSAYRDGTIYIGGINGELTALQASSGRQLWKTSLGQSIKSLTIGEKAIFVGGSQGRVSAVALSGGELLWHDDLGGVLTRQPFVLDEQIYFATGSKVVYSYKIF